MEFLMFPDIAIITAIVLLMVFSFWMLAHAIANPQLSVLAKCVWVILILFVSILGPIAYCALNFKEVSKAIRSASHAA